MPSIEYTRTLSVDEEWLHSAVSYLNDFIPFDLTPKQFWDILKENPDLLQSSIDLGFDTGEREWAMNIISKNLLGVDWPTYGESLNPKYRNFYYELRDAGKKVGYKLK